MNPTIYHFDQQTHDANLLERKDQHVHDFQNWLDGTLFVNQELKEKTINLLTPPHHDAFHEDTKGGKTLNPEKPEEVESSSAQGSSSVEKETVRNISWGERKVDDNEESLRL